MLFNVSLLSIFMSGWCYMSWMHIDMLLTYMYIYTYIHTHIYACILTCMWQEKLSSWTVHWYTVYCTVCMVQYTAVHVYEYSSVKISCHSSERIPVFYMVQCRYSCVKTDHITRGHHRKPSFCGKVWWKPTYVNVLYVYVYHRYSMIHYLSLQCINRLVSLM